MFLGSTLVVDGKIYMPGSKGLHVLATGKEAKLLAKVNVESPIYASPIAVNGTHYIASNNGWLWAVRN
jgi:outer membrane protein assembly factor BamB